MKNELEIVSDGTIELCPHQGCSHTCCDFANGNFIALFPGEVAKAQAEAKSLAHLDVVPDGAGGHRAICQAQDKASCDNGYKPLDCASYPLFPAVGRQGHLVVALKGSKCPLQLEDLAAQCSWVKSRWMQLCDSVVGISEWLATVRLVGYEHIIDSATDSNTESEKNMSRPPSSRAEQREATGLRLPDEEVG